MAKSRRTPYPSRRYASIDEARAAIEQQLGREAIQWVYQDHDGEPAGAVLRFGDGDKKTYRPISRRSDGWSLEAMEKPRPLYRLPTLATAELVVVTEGEKAADAAVLLGYTATTSYGGAKAPAQTDWSPLAGRDVVILPDNDDAGKNYAEDVTDLLLALAPPARIRIVELTGLQPGGDLADKAVGADADGLAALRAEVDEVASQAAPIAPPEHDGSEDRYIPFPTHALPPSLGRFVTAGARSIGCDEAYLALPVLAVCGAAIGNSRRLRAKDGWLAPAVIWAAVLGESGSAKSPAMRLALQPARTRDEEKYHDYQRRYAEYERQLAVYERDVAAFKRSKDANDPPGKPTPPQQERSVLSDVTIEALASRLASTPRGLLLAVDELAGWLQGLERYSSGKNQGDASRYLSLYNADALIVDRKTGIPPTIRIQQAYVCIAGGIQPAILRRCFTQEHRDSGLLARFLLASPPRRAKQWTEATVPAEVANEYRGVILRLYDLTPEAVWCGDDEFRPVEIPLSAAAKQTYQRYFDDHNAEAQDLSGDLASAWAKLEETPLRLALIIHCVRAVAGEAIRSESEVDESSMAMAIEITEWFKRETRRVYAIFHESDSESERRTLTEWIERRGGAVSGRELQQGVRGFKKAADARRALGTLVAAGLGTWETAGRKSKFVLRPLRSPPPQSSVETVDVDRSEDHETDWGTI